MGYIKKYYDITFYYRYYEFDLTIMYYSDLKHTKINVHYVKHTISDFTQSIILCIQDHI
jgi:hypothetical protein